MADDLLLLREILEIGKQICEEVRRNVFVAYEEIAEKLRNNCVQLLIALVLSTRNLKLNNNEQQKVIIENVNLLNLEIQKYILMFEERFNEQDGKDSAYSCPYTESGGQGRPKLYIPQEQLEGLRSLGFSWSAVAKMLGVSGKTVSRRSEEFNISKQAGHFSDITDNEIDSLVKHVLEFSQNSGERMILGWFKGRGIRVQRWRLRESISRVDPIGRELRKKTVTKRRVYSVPTPNSLWYVLFILLV